MAKLPGVTENLLNGNLGLVPVSAEQTIIYLACSTGGTVNQLNFYGDPTTVTSALGLGELPEVVSYANAVAGSIVGGMTLPPTTPGGLSGVTHFPNLGSGTISVSSAPHKSILVTIVNGGALGTATATFSVGGASSGPAVTLPVGGNYLVPGTYCVITFGSGTYIALDTYAVSTLGGIVHSGTGTPTVTEASSPIDAFNPIITVTTAGAAGTAQVTYSLDGTAANTSAALVIPGGGSYALPNTGIVITLSGSLTVGDAYSFQSVGPMYSNSDLTAALTALQTTYINSSYSMVACVGNLASAAAWVTQSGTLDTAGVALFGKGTSVRLFNGAPTVGTITASGGSVVVDSADTDSVLQTARASVSSARVLACAGDAAINSVISGLSFRRNALWAVSAECASINAARNPGDVSLGGLTGVTALYRDEAATPALDGVQFNTLRTFVGNISAGTGLPGFFVTDFHSMDVVTSDYSPGMNCRVMDRAATVARALALPYTNSQVPTTTRNGIAGVITQQRAAQINSKLTSGLQSQLVLISPQDAVGAIAQVNLTHNILADSNLIIGIAIQPFAYSKYITLNLGFAVQV